MGTLLLSAAKLPPQQFMTVIILYGGHIMHYWVQLLEKATNKNVKNFLFSESSNSRKNSKTKSQKKAIIYKLGSKYQNKHFSQREGECMLLMLKGKTIFDTAKILGLSPRTVEYYLKNMKQKIGCRTKSELIAAILNSEFLQNLVT